MYGEGATADICLPNDGDYYLNKDVKLAASAEITGGVYVQNSRTFLVSGDCRITDNVCIKDGETWSEKLPMGSEVGSCAVETRYVRDDSDVIPTVPVTVVIQPVPVVITAKDQTIRIGDDPAWTADSYTLEGPDRRQRWAQGARRGVTVSNLSHYTEPGPAPLRDRVRVLLFQLNVQKTQTLPFLLAKRRIFCYNKQNL